MASAASAASGRISEGLFDSAVSEDPDEKITEVSIAMGVPQAPAGWLDGSRHGKSLHCFQWMMTGDMAMDQYLYVHTI